MPAPETSVVAASYVASQHALADRTSELVLAYWASTMGDSSGSSDLRSLADKWLALSIPVILRARRLSGQYGQAFYKAQRRIELPTEPSFRMPTIAELDQAALTTSLWFTGPRIYVDKGISPETMFDQERLNAIAGAVSRHSLNGGRDAVEAAYEVDPKAIGYYRVEDGDPCYFCAMLMSRGIAFKEDSFDESDPRFFGPGDAKVHDHCGGSLAPAYDRTLSPELQKFKDMWDGGGWDPVNGDVVLGWRHFYDGQRQAAAA